MPENLHTYRTAVNPDPLDSARKSPLGDIARIWLHHKLYWAACKSQGEADNLVAVLNANAVNDAIKPFQAVGLLGEGGIHKKVLDLPIPAYKDSETAHRDLATLGANARAQAAKLVTSADFPTSLALRRGLLRAQLSKSLAEIDKIAASSSDGVPVATQYGPWRRRLARVSRRLRCGRAASPR